MLNLADLAAEQWGLVTTAQARSVGVSPQTVARLTNNGALERMTHGVYRVTGAPAAPLDTLRAAWLTLDPARRAGERLRDLAPAVVSHRSAASIYRLGDLEADQFEFTSGERKQTRRPDIRIHRGRVDTGEWTVVDGLPVTTVIRTVDDLASDRIDGGHLSGVVRDALIRQQVDDSELINVLRRHAHHYSAPLGDGEALLRRLLQESGISQPVERAVALALTSPESRAQLSETLEMVQRAFELAIPDAQSLITPQLLETLKAIQGTALFSPELTKTLQPIQIQNLPMSGFLQAVQGMKTMPAPQLTETLQAVQTMLTPLSETLKEIQSSGLTRPGAGSAHGPANGDVVSGEVEEE